MHPDTRRPRLALLCLAAALAVALITAAAAQAYPAKFASHPHPISVTYNGQYLLATGGDSATTECSDNVFAYNANGVASQFTTLRNQPGCLGSELENYMVTVPADQPYWPAGVTYVARGGHIYELQRDGSFTHFSYGPCTDSDIPGITLDTTGSFFYLMFVTCARSGQVFYIDNAGISHLFASLAPNFIEAPQVAPAGFPGLGKTLMVTDEVSGRIYALPLGGGVSTITGLSSPEDIKFIPPKLCTFGDGSYFSAVPPGEIARRKPTDFTGLTGAVVTGENGGLWIMSAPDKITPFQANFDLRRTYEGSTFITYPSGCGVAGGTPGAAKRTAFAAKGPTSWPPQAMPHLTDHKIVGFKPFVLRNALGVPRGRFYGPKSRREALRKGLPKRAGR